MRRLIAAVAAVWAVLAIALVLALGHRPTASSQSTAGTTIVLVRQANGTLTTLPVGAHAVTQTSGSAGTGQPLAAALNTQLLSSATAGSSHATTRTS